MLIDQMRKTRQRSRSTFSRFRALAEKENNQTMYQVLFTYMSFRNLIYQKKLEKIHEDADDPDRVFFDDFYVARMIANVPQNPNNMKIYE